MKPIPRKILIHSANLYSQTHDRWQMETAGTPTALSFVRIEPSSKIVLSKDSTEKQLTAVLIYDCINSRPRNTSFSVGQMITSGGIEYHVESVEVLSDERHPHHIEVGLV